MKKPLVVFGAGVMAEVADFYFTHDSDYRVVAFTADRPYVTDDRLFGRPLIAFDDIQDAFPPDDNDLFVALSYYQLNHTRRIKYEEARAKGYTIATYVSSRATVWPGLAVGENCFVLEDNTLQPYCRIGDNVTLWSGNHIGHHSVIGAHTFVASHVVVSGGVEIGECCFIGVNATLRDHITIGDRCVIGAGALVLRDTEPDGVYVGSPARRTATASSELERI